ncbi:DNA replication factor GINS [Methanofollis sp. W23]|uniref:DNA replication complex GINS family protein n=1 Tax=Methanofollis sp. W23 TaxID=2817849 RepID=UPI001AE7F57D|nr:DNA replication complex GINS family protein [Methanofollis sp. W23]MBP2146045.1 DNA replication factor GINS [Methanofollis sp. W23]
MMDLDDLRIIVWNERESGKLSEIPNDLFRAAKVSLDELYDEIDHIRDPFSEESAVLQDRFQAIKETLNAIIKIRLKKILRLAEAQNEAEYSDKEELKLMLPAERAMFDAVCGEIAACRSDLLKGTEREFTLSSAPHEPGPVPLPHEEEGPALEVTPESETALVLIREEVPEFMGLDGRTYALEREDIVTLPRENADVLCGRNIALNIRLIK